MNEELEALRHENSLLRDIVRQTEPDREAKEYYERMLTELGKLIGCEHLDDRLPSCFSDVIDKGDDAIKILQTICQRQGVLPQGIQKIEEFLKTCGIRNRRG